jgi:K+-sensing histidine kinase KdpD
MARETHLEHPNRSKSSSRSTKWVTVGLLVLTAVLVLIVTIGGWEALQGAQVVQVAYILLFLLLAFLVARWRSGVLPVIAALAMILLIFAAISGPQWFDRDGRGFADTTLPAELLGFVTLLIVPVQVLLIGAAMSGFRQKWNVEVEVDDDPDHPPYRRHGGAIAAPA